MSDTIARVADGIRRRHSRGCPSLSGGRCKCNGGYEAAMYARDGRKVRKTFPTLAAARTWRADSLVARRRGAFQGASPATVRAAATELLEGMGRGTVRTRAGDEYKPSVLRSYESALRLHVLPELGGLRLSDITRRHVQTFADRLLASGSDPSSIRNALMPLRVIARRAIEDGILLTNPCASLRLPAVRSQRTLVVSPERVSGLLGALTPPDRAIYATAFYAGLRSGELRAIRWEDIDLESGLIHVVRAMDDRGGIIEPKSKAGKRTVPVVPMLRSILLAHKLASGRRDGLALAFTPTALRSRARPGTRARA